MLYISLNDFGFASCLSGLSPWIVSGDLLPDTASRFFRFGVFLRKLIGVLVIKLLKLMPMGIWGIKHVLVESMAELVWGTDPR